MAKTMLREKKENSKKEIEGKLHMKNIGYNKEKRRKIKSKN